MRRITAEASQWRAQKCSGKNLAFNRCKGGYFSTLEDYALKVIGKTVGVRCVKAGTKIIVLGKNLFNKNTVVQGGYLSTSNAVISNASWAYSDYIAVKPNTKYTLRSQPIGIAPATCFYTANKTFISGVMHNNVNPKVFTTPANAVFARVSVHANSLSNAQFEEGETATPYVAFDANSAALPCDLYEGDVWYSMNGVVQRQNGSTEQYDPQPIFAPQGSVTVTQEPIELMADLSATMLVRR